MGSTWNMYEQKSGSAETEPCPDDQQVGRGVKKRPYRKPEFRADAVFETAALTCGKVAQTSGPCFYNRKHS